VDNNSDSVIENAGEGVDTIRTTLSTFFLPPNVEDLLYVATLNAQPNPTPGKATSGSTALFGNALPNVITGGVGQDYINGGLGADTAIGGKGDDLYEVDRVTDRVVERPGEGVDTVSSSADDFTLPDNVENLNLIGSHALSIGTGNALANVINGNGDANALSGEAGNDRLFGSGGGDLLLGGDGNDQLDGGTGADDMEGGKGDDTYTVDDAGDTTREADAEGFDTVISLLANYSVQVGQSIEKVIVDELASAAGVTGNAIANIIIGNSQINALNGGGGNDKLDGAGGNDELTGTDSALRGVGEIDTLTGGAGADLFFLGDTSGVFYDDGNADSPGKGDFALITDFKPAAGDRVAFFGQSTGIIAAFTGVSANLGTGSKFYAGIGIFRDFDDDGVVDTTGSPDELLALIHNFTAPGLDFADYSVFLQV
jgi:Ca2+-binding RTX toxin-like protein